MRLQHGLIILALGAPFACTQQSTSYEPTPRVNQNGNGGTGGSGGGSDANVNENGTPEGEDFFDGSIVAAFRKTSNGCLDCHDAPRNVLGNPDAADEAIYDYDKMFSLLKKGGFSNDNDFINPMLGEAPHPGAQICEDEGDELCALAVEWFDIEFAGTGSRYGEIEKVDISFTGINVVGNAKDINNPDTVLALKAYVGGDKDSGTLVGEGEANGFENAYNFRLTGLTDSRDSTEKEVYIYAVVDGEEQELGGSPFKFIAYGPRGGTFPGAGALGINNGCACHEGGHTYESLWPDLILPFDGPSASKGDKVGPQDNYLYNLATGARGDAHPANRVGTAQAIADWWCAEFDPAGTGECGP